MTRAAIVVALLGVAVAGIFLAQRERGQPSADVAPVLNVVGDVQRAVARIPASVTRMSDAEEVNVGHALTRAASPTPDAGTATDAELDAYVARVGTAVARGARRQLPYAFYVIHSPTEVNAFALPGGPVFIGTGLMALMHTEDELAAVLGHEVEHIDHYHCSDRYQSERVMGSVPIIGGLAEVPLAIFEAGYSKTQELEADVEGVRLAYLAGYSPLAVGVLFETMERTAAETGARPPGRARTPIGEIARLPVGAFVAYFRSHPPSAERVARIRDAVRDDRLDATRPTRPLEHAVPAASALRRTCERPARSH